MRRVCATSQSRGSPRAACSRGASASRSTAPRPSRWCPRGTRAGWGGSWRSSCCVRRSARERTKGESLMAAPQRDLPLAGAEPGWRRPRLAPSLAEVYRSVPVSTGAWWRKALAFAGPGYLVAVGYMDPGNWATDLAGGSRFGYALLSVILLSNLMAILLQGLAAKPGIVTGRDLAQACRDHASRPASLALWVLCEIAIAACDLAEVIGSRSEERGVGKECRYRGSGCE